MTNDQRRYHPGQIEELDDPVSLLNDPPPPDVALLVPRARRPLRAVLCEALTNIQALLTRLEAGVGVPTWGHETVRRLYVATRAQRDALAACLEIDGLE